MVASWLMVFRSSQRRFSQFPVSWGLWNDMKWQKTFRKSHGTTGTTDPRFAVGNPHGMWGIYPLVNVYIAVENHHAINGKIHYFDWAIFNSYFDITRGYGKNCGGSAFFRLRNPSDSRESKKRQQEGPWHGISKTRSGLLSVPLTQ